MAGDTGRHRATGRPGDDRAAGHGGHRSEHRSLLLHRGRGSGGRLRGRFGPEVVARPARAWRRSPRGPVGGGGQGPGRSGGAARTGWSIRGCAPCATTISSTRTGSRARSPGARVRGLGGGGVNVDVERLRANLAEIERRIEGACSRAGRGTAFRACLWRPSTFDVDEMGVLAEAGIRLVGENRAEGLEAKWARWNDVVRVPLHRAPAEPEGCGRCCPTFR